MADIGPLSAKLIANAEGVKKGIDQAKAMLQGGAAAMGASAEKAGQSMGSKLASGFQAGVSKIMGIGKAALGMFARGLSDPIGAISDMASGLGEMMDKIPIVGKLFAASLVGAAGAIAAVAAIFESELESIIEAGKLSTKLGMDIEDFTVMAVAAGNAEKAAMALGKLQLAMARTGETEFAVGAAAEAFKLLGLNAADLAARPLLESFGEVADRIRELPSATLQAAAAFKLFGRSGMEMLPLLQKGSAFLDKIKGKIEFFGAGDSEAELASARAIKEARRDFDLMRAGFASEIFSGLAPILAELHSTFGELKLTFAGMGGVIVDVLEGASKFALALKEAFVSAEVRSSLFDLFGDVAAFFGNKLLQAMMVGLGQVFKAIGTVHLSAFGKSIGQVEFGPIGELLGEHGRGFGIDALVNKRGIKNIWKNLTEGLAKTPAGAALEGFWKRVRDRLDGVGLTARHNDPFALWSESAQKFLESGESPISKVQGELRQLGKLMELTAFHAAGGVGPTLPNAMAFLEGPLFGTHAALKAAALMKQLESAAGDPFAVRTVGAMREGSKEAFSVLAARRNEIQMTPADKIRRLLEILNIKQEEEIKVGKEILAAVREGKINLRIGGP